MILFDKGLIMCLYEWEDGVFDKWLLGYCDVVKVLCDVIDIVSIFLDLLVVEGVISKVKGVGMLGFSFEKLGFVSCVEMVELCLQCQVSQFGCVVIEVEFVVVCVVE